MGKMNQAQIEVGHFTSCSARGTVDNLTDLIDKYHDLIAADKDVRGSNISRFQQNV